jgi:proline iminopeptidase
MKRRALHPHIEPNRTGSLSVSDLHTIFYEEVGNPRGRAALFLHGGPGVGILPDYRRFFDPDFYRVVLPDQRGAGRSTPFAELRENTTWDLVEDLEKLRRHLDIDSWIVMGGSWGSTLAISYAITHPDRVAGIIIRGVFLARPFEVDWIHGADGAARIFPDAYEEYLAPLPEDGRADTVRAYYEILTGEDEAARLLAARSWSRWEASTMTLLPDPRAVGEMIDEKTALAIGRIECHYTLHRFFMETDDHLLENVGRIRHIPCRIVQGRYDVICPMVSAWDLHRALNHSELRIVPDGSHSPLEGGMAHELVTAADDFKRL